MLFTNLIKLILILIIPFINSCTNTRIILEGTKKIIMKEEAHKNEKKFSNENSNNTSGHFKVGNEYIIEGKKYKPKLYSSYNKTGVASWYGPKFNKKITANGEIFDQDKISAAHKTLPLPSIVKVTNLENNYYIYVRVNDRGPFVNNRIIDLSKKAAIRLNFLKKGTVSVNVKLIETGPHLLNKKFISHDFITKYAASIENSNHNNQYDRNRTLLQIGVFKSFENANNLLDFLKSKISDNLFLQTYKKETGDITYKLFAGPFNNDKAQRVAEKLLDLGYSTIYKNNED